MTKSYLIKRILWLFPALLIVLVMAFMLKNVVPGDPVESILMHRGISIQDLERHTSTYEKLYKAENYHLPLFYFSILPDHYPANIHNIIQGEERKNVKRLLKQGYTFNDISAFLKMTDQWNSTADTSALWQQKSWQQLIRFEKAPDKILDYLQNRAIFSMEEQKKVVENLKKIIDSKVRISVPTIHWYGAHNQFHNYLMKVVLFDFGVSAKDGKKVTGKISSALSWTAVLIFFSLLILFSISIPLGIWNARHEGSRLDRWTEKWSVLLYAIPVFWLASMLIIFFTSDQYSPWLHIFPTVGTWYVPGDQNFWQTFLQHSKHLILPVLCLTANDFAFLIRLIKMNALAQKNKPFVKVSLARGLSDSTILWKQIFPNVSVSILAVLIGMIPAAFAGSLVVEVIFNIPGMGRLLYNSLLSADWNVVFAILILLSMVTIICNLLGDIFIARLHPLIRYGKE